MQDSELIHDQRMWSIKQCADVFGQSVGILKERLKEKIKENSEHGYLIWDKVCIFWYFYHRLLENTEQCNQSTRIGIC